MKRRISSYIVLAAFVVFIICTCSVFFSLHSSMEEGNIEKEDYQTDPDSLKVYTSIMVKNIRRYNLEDGTYKVSFYLTFMWDKDQRDHPAAGDVNMWEIMNGEIDLDSGGIVPIMENASVDGELNEGPDGSYLANHYLVHALLNNRVNLRKYPFDMQTVSIRIENTYWGKDHVEYLPDEGMSEVFDDAYVHGYFIGNIEDHTSTTEYTAWGEYSRYNLDIVIVHESSLFYKTLLPAIMLFLVSFLVHFINPQDLESRLTLIFTIILGSISHHLSVSGLLPPTGYMHIFDAVVVNSYVTISIVLLWSIVVNYNMRKDMKKGKYINDNYTNWVIVALLVNATVVHLSFLF